MKIYNIVSGIFDRNPMSYKMLRKIKNGGVRDILALVGMMPLIPIFNVQTKKRIREIKENGNVLQIGDSATMFYLPNLDLKKGEFIQNCIFLGN